MAKKRESFYKLRSRAAARFAKLRTEIITSSSSYWPLDNQRASFELDQAFFAGARWAEDAIYRKSKRK